MKLYRNSILDILYLHFISHSMQCHLYLEKHKFLYSEKVKRSAWLKWIILVTGWTFLDGLVYNIYYTYIISNIAGNFVDIL